MNTRPLIGIGTQTLQACDGIPEGLPLSWTMNHRYMTVLAQLGAAPVMVPLLDSDTEALRAIYDRLDGIFLAGGVDMDPLSYGAERHELCGRTDLPRDRVEMDLARWAIEDGKPIFGICRGMQVINVVAGGTLYQDCTDQIPGAIKHDYFPTQGYERDYLAHEIHLAEGSRLREVFEATTVQVNSMHHQGIWKLGEGLIATAFAPDGLIEAIEAEDRSKFVVGVQWHPEMLVDSDAPTRELFHTFMEAAAEFSGREMDTEVLQLHAQSAI